MPQALTFSSSAAAAAILKPKLPPKHLPLHHAPPQTTPHPPHSAVADSHAPPNTHAPQALTSSSSSVDILKPKLPIPPPKHLHLSHAPPQTIHPPPHSAVADSHAPPMSTHAPQALTLSASIPKSKHLHLPHAPPSTTPPQPHSAVDDSHAPQNFHAPPPSTELQEKILYLDSLGIDSFRCFDTHAPLISATLRQLKSVVEFLKSLDLSVHDIRRMIHMCPDILTSPVSTTLTPAVDFLRRDAAVESSNLAGVIRRRPRLLTRDLDQLRPTLDFLENTIGIEQINSCATLLSCSVEKKFIPRIDYFQKIGFSKQESMEIFKKFPALFCYSIEENLEPKFNYFLVEMGRELKELMDYPQYFSFSLEKRIKPRHRICVEEGVCLSLPIMLKSSEVRFRERLEVCCSSSMPVRTSPLWRAKFDDTLI